MQCPNCGTELRATARFCNHCGAPAASAAGQSTDRTVLASGGTTATIVNSRSDVGQASAPAVPPASGMGMGPAMGRAADAPASAAERPSSRPAVTVQLDDWGRRSADATSTEHAGSELHGPALLPQMGASGRPDDQLPWPLPTNIIMDGRYRVEMLLSSSDTEASYRVSDLRGYERCWACGYGYGAAGAGDRFCHECGADMLGREYIMYERQLAESDPLTAERPNAVHQEDADAPRTFVQSGRAYRVEPTLPQRAAFPQGARLIAGAATDLGRTRSGEQNEDSAFVLVLDRVHENHTLPFGVFVVADGLGGHASGNRASRKAINVLAHTVLRQVALPVVGTPTDTPVDETVLSGLLADAVRAANGSLCADNRESGLDAGSTVVAVLIYGETAHIANVGDSRAYVCDGEGLRRITSDHSLVQQLMEGGLIRPEDVYTHPQRNQIFRSLGDDPDLPVDLYVQQLRPGMRLLLCSDGLWEMVRDPQIEELLRAASDPQAACDALIKAANEGGGEDNITAVIVEAR